jgi:phage tail sheath protein FI
MPFQLSPGVAVVEKDFSSIIPAVATSTGAFAGAFQWGPIEEPVTISSENVLVQRFGKPSDANAQSFFTAANFLSYANNLLVTRADSTGARNAVAIKSGTITSFNITEPGLDYVTAPHITISAPDEAGGIQATATAVLTNGAISSINITNHGTGYTQNPTVTVAAPPVGGTQAVVQMIVTTGGVKIKNTDHYLMDFAAGEGVVGEFAAKYAGALGNSIEVSMADATTFAAWDYKSSFDSAPGTSDYAASSGASNDELHVIIIDANGAWTGTSGAVLEKFAFVSKASDAKKSDGTNNYYKDVINSRSQYIWWMDHVAGKNWGTAAGTVEFDSLSDAYYVQLSGGVTDLAVTDGNLMNAWGIFVDDTRFDIRLIPLGKASATVANYVISNVAEVRLDCVVFASPENVDTGDIIIASGSTATDAIIAYRNALPSSSYASLDSGYKYQYDRYNDKYRWVPLNGDVAGLCARTDYQADPWFSPGGLNRGQIKNVVKLAVNPNQADRDNLYKNGVNPVVTFPGQGTVLYGDKTLLAKPSAFDRINVRRLFIVLEKAIATAAKFQLFEFNDSFTQAQFRNLVEPFLRDVQGRRGITEFVVKCDATNNTPQIVDTNQFVADIYVKPNRSINFITLNFIAARSSISFSEIGGGV